ncbi:immunoglobulin I-set domain protein [Ancylostoma duodenale]|uniref:Immunoglobulin I-set domain protein n=1 Tax=Ancylostoma duodenale TaxID=51022 RepID=A0A0C2C5H9_9BILA|nr:immunoglobulin I-set domain protein [Ancylostoma duodenale]
MAPRWCGCGKALYKREVREEEAMEGRPAPTVEWFNNNGQLITASEKYKIENTALNTVLTIKNICVRDRGEYKLRIRNRCGEDTFSISIQVRSRSKLCYIQRFLNSITSCLHIFLLRTGDGGDEASSSGVVNMHSPTNPFHKQCLYISELVVFPRFPVLPPPQLATMQEKKTQENSRRHSIGALKKVWFRE